MGGTGPLDSNNYSSNENNNTTYDRHRHQNSNGEHQLGRDAVVGTAAGTAGYAATRLRGIPSRTISTATPTTATTTTTTTTTAIPTTW